ncbi:MAG: Rieske 2Fe-2S domain-containing protein [Gemmatimonadota bacterium]|jgi:3-phenylpropionate/trans-cinnamate dioxygenase ferredoxin subunit|nr:Rieske 2Fe-2S domain-containing protein [Gemmatimonadota bacterium]
MPKYIAGLVEDIPSGTRKIVELAERSIGIFNVDGVFYALRNLCPHQGGPLCQGRQTGFLEAETPGDFVYTRHGEMLRCPWHGWQFDITTGRAWIDPERIRTRKYSVSVESGEGLAADDIPSAAETYDVSIDQQYVVIDIP